jgi:hypothetical protein
MKILPYILSFLLVGACRHQQENKKFLTTDFKYSTYTWHINHDSYQWEFHLADYLHVDSNGHFKLIKHNPDSLDKHFYFSGTINDSIRQIIDSMLLENKFLPEIKTDGLSDTPLIIYDGFTYLLDYKIINKTQAKIQYINSSSRTPENIISLTSFLDSLINETQSNKIDSFSIKRYIDTLKKISSYNLPPPPEQPPPTDKSFRFIPPKTKQ